MKAILLNLLIVAAIVMVPVEANWLADDEDSYAMVERSSDDYKTAKKHPEALRQCVKCVGIQRQLGKNVKQATDYCNRNDCPLSPKREILMNYLRELALEAEESYDKRK